MSITTGPSVDTHTSSAAAEDIILKLFHSLLLYSNHFISCCCCILTLSLTCVHLLSYPLSFVILTHGCFPPAGHEFDVKAKCVINATGPFTDSLRKMDNQETKNICQPSAGVHIVIPGYYRYLRKPLKGRFVGISKA